MIKICIQRAWLLAALAGTCTLIGCRPQPSSADQPAHRNVIVRYSDPYDSPQEFMEGIYAADHSIDPPHMPYRIRAVIVPHHLTASTSIAAGIRMLKYQSFTKILLLSPDHFGKCPTLLCTTSGVSATKFGIVEPDAATVAALSALPETTVAPKMFEQEHGIHAVLPYIAHYFPQVAVTPVAVSQNRLYGSNGQLLDAIVSALDEDTMLIVSSDFSHYLTLPRANAMDEETAKILFSKDLPGIAKLKNPAQSDCPNCLWVLATIADRKGFYNPSVVMHTNSAVILDEPTVKETTSHFSMVWYQNADLSGDDLAIAGDVTMTRVRRTPTLKEPLLSFWSGSGTRLVNLEGPLSEHCKSNRSMFDFCNRMDLWKGMLGIATHWGVLNNHTLDQHAKGLPETERLIRLAGETPVGDVMVETGAYRFISLTDLMNPVFDVHAMDRKKQYTDVISRLADKMPGTMTVVLVHEGKEYRALTSDAENAYLQSFIDAGADVVVASHTHVQSDMTIYKGKLIFRGVGNLMFDQWFSLPTQTAKAVRLRMTPEGILFQSMIALQLP